MKRKRHIRQTSAKSLVFDPLFRPRQEKAKKGKGSYARRPRNQSQDSGPFSFAALLRITVRAELVEALLLPKAGFDKLSPNG